jgi:valyl-tRNA synthetase
MLGDTAVAVHPED